MDMDYFMLIFGCIFAAFATVGLGFLIFIIRRESKADKHSDGVDKDLKTVGTAKLFFLTKEEGGQSIIPVRTFSSHIIFEEDRELIHGLWSAVIEFHKSPNTQRETTADLYLLFHDKEEAPNHLIKPGMKFELTTNKVIAKGIIENLKS
ncbi:MULTISPECIES: hypothetical protein [Paenibacillus]|uniref:Uncharacterized protein n=3 Tax=Paenibacillus TaxID=44249 RepID=A0ABU3RQA6_9BACL|nr:hypothetical protein [Paenibacillus anseongense]MDU0206486.1 hypothetical protein [Paenibacillus sp. PFR10]MEC0267354.1 hypothetical protein [Paenibacillus anseongense]